MLFEPNRNFALQSLDDFASHSAKNYAETRNYDFGKGNHSNVSMLSPYLRRKVLREDEVIRIVLEKNEKSRVEKFIDEVLWRTYWKGCLERRPSVWTNYLESLKNFESALQDDTELGTSYRNACRAETSIECFDYWVHELVSTGYLHNHARMWFASIWIFTLKLPWELGADFFYKNLFDADPASNTLSWRWVAGLHTKGKHYLATESNIKTFSPSRFSGQFSLPKQAAPLEDNARYPETEELGPYQSSFPKENFCLLFTDENLRPALGNSKPKVIIALRSESSQSSYAQKLEAQSFVEALLVEMAKEASKKFEIPLFIVSSAEELGRIALQSGCDQICTSFCPVGTTKSLLSKLSEELPSKLSLIEVIEPWESRLYPLAKKGFFDFKKNSGSEIAGLLGIS